MIHNLFVQVKKADKKFLPIAALSLFFSIGIVAAFYKLHLPLSLEAPIKSFKDRIMGNCSLNNIDISLRLRNYALWFVFLVILTVLCFFIFTYLIGKFYNEKEFSLNNEFNLFEEFFIVGLVLSGYYFLNSKNNIALYYILFSILLLALFIFIKLIWFHKLNLYIFRFFLILVLPATLFAYPFLMRHSSAISKKTLFLFVFCAAVVYFVLQFLLKRLFSHKMEYDKYAVVLILTGIPVFSTGILQSIFLEARNIFEKRGLPYVANPYHMYAALMVFAVLCSAVIFLLLLKKPELTSSFTADSVIQKIYYPLILLTVALVIFQPDSAVSPWPEYFETANHGLALDALFRYGSIPVIQNFDAHLLSNELPGILYYLLNGYEPWAYILYNRLYFIPFILICYYFLKGIITPRQALLFVLFLPFLFQIFNSNFDTNYIFSILLFFIIFRLLNRQKTQDYYYFWLVTAFLLLYRLDVGASAAIGGLVTIGLGCLIYKIKLSVKKFLLSGIITGTFFGLIYLVLCLIKGVNPVSRFFEIISLCNSNQSWAYITQGDPNNIGYILCYYIFPLAIILSAIVLIAKFTGNETIRNGSKRYAVIGFLYFTGFYLSNLQRGIVRHSLAEQTSVLILSTFGIAVICYLFSRHTSHKFFKMTIACLLLVALSNIAFKDIKTRISSQASCIDTAATKYETLEPYSQKDIRNSRVEGEMVSGEAADLKAILDCTLSPDETYLDFSSLNYYYALTGRKNPLYVNQSPLMITGDSGQNYALQELKKSNVVYALMPKTGLAWTNIDQIPVCLKYYKLSEYIYSNYTPLLSLQNADLWCLKTQKSSLKAKLDQSELVKGKPVDLNKIDLLKLAATRCTVKRTSEGIEITPHAGDPNISNLIAAIKDLPGFSTESIRSLYFTVNSAANQKIQLYYTTSGTSCFTEKNSSVYLETAGNNKSFVFKIGSDIDQLRFDMDAPVTITKISANASDSTYTDTYNDSNFRSLGYIPMEWGENDPSDSYENVKTLLSFAKNTSVPSGVKAQFNFNGMDFSQQPDYLSFSVYSAADGIATLNYGVKSRGKANQVGSISFSTKAGYHRYMIRISSYYDWWSNPVNYMTFSDTAGVTVQEASVKQGD